jgi:hypothetical protein
VVFIVVEDLLVVVVLVTVVSLIFGVVEVVKVVLDQLYDVVVVIVLVGCGFGGFPGIMPPGVVSVIAVLPSQYAVHPLSVIFLMTVLKPFMPPDVQNILLSSFVIVGGLATYSMWYTGLPDLMKLLYVSHSENLAHSSLTAKDMRSAT